MSNALILKLENRNFFVYYDMLVEMFHGKEVEFVSIQNGQPLQMSGTAELSVSATPTRKNIDFKVQGGFIGSQSFTFVPDTFFFIEQDLGRLTVGGPSGGFVIFKLLEA
jgi:hypothetical protein